MLHIYIRNIAYINIEKGIKKYELRLFRGVFKNIKIGDTVCLCNREMGMSFQRVVSNILKFTNFEQLLLKLDIKNCLVQYSDIEKGLGYMNTIYKPSLQKKHNCIALAFN
jgi:ASC-1-like (ASCH) protein